MPLNLSQILDQEWKWQATLYSQVTHSSITRSCSISLKSQSWSITRYLDHARSWSCPSLTKPHIQSESQDRQIPRNPSIWLSPFIYSCLCSITRFTPMHNLSSSNSDSLTLSSLSTEIRTLLTWKQIIISPRLGAYQYTSCLRAYYLWCSPLPRIRHKLTYDNSCGPLQCVFRC